MTKRTRPSSTARTTQPDRRWHLRSTAVLLVLVLLASACTLGEGTVELVASSDGQQTPEPTAVVEQPTPAPTTVVERPTPTPTAVVEQPTPEPERPTPEPERPTPEPERPTPEPNIERLQLRPVGGGMDGFSGTGGAESVLSVSTSSWSWRNTVYNVYSAVALGGINEDVSSWAGGRRRFTPPQSGGLSLHMNMTLDASLNVAVAVGVDVQISVVARIKEIESGDVVKKIQVFDEGLGERFTENLVGWVYIENEELLVAEALPPLSTSEQYHVELEVRCNVKVYVTVTGHGVCSADALVLNDAYISYVA